MTEQTTQVDVNDGAYVNFVSNLNTGRDKASHGTFQRISVPDDQIEAVYQDWLAKKIINRPVQDMLRAGWYFTGIDENQSLALQAEMARVKLIDRLYKALIWMRKYGKAYLLLGMADGKSLDQPLDLSLLSRGQLQFITVLKHSEVSALTYEYLPLELTAGEPFQPKYYEYKQRNNSKIKVHSSRLIKLANGEEEESALLPIYYTLRNFASTNAGAASLVHEAKIDVIKFPGLMDAIKNRAKDVMERFGAAALMKSLNGMLVIDANEQYESKSYTFGGLPDLMREFSQQTAGAADMPYTILFGQTTSGLNNSGEFDLRSYYDRVNTEQNWMLKPLLDLLMPVLYRNIYGQAPSGMKTLFNALWQLDAKTRSEIEKNNKERDEAYLERGIITDAQVAKQLREDKVYDFLTDEHIKALELTNEDPTD
ncbi:DUF1073 domain-containing protein [Acinetobacter sp. SWAC57]|uniref:DUF1073 domain-containing protein n=1 Tax=Acinetobacter sp. SWAC57 TaxID=2293834 RepID=UPI000E5B72BA|nr:DUF1073 domain-containing protein [Acinetobacter sp. SWAC57]RGD93378.1 DUF1073 domain-containing protein [Acinetobacter sp. SWAC57]